MNQKTQFAELQITCYIQFLSKSRAYLENRLTFPFPERKVIPKMTSVARPNDQSRRLGVFHRAVLGLHPSDFGWRITTRYLIGDLVDRLVDRCRVPWAGPLMAAPMTSLAHPDHDKILSLAGWPTTGNHRRNQPAHNNYSTFSSISFSLNFAAFAAKYFEKVLKSAASIPQ